MCLSRNSHTYFLLKPGKTPYTILQIGAGMFLNLYSAVHLLHSSVPESLHYTLNAFYNIIHISKITHAVAIVKNPNGFPFQVHCRCYQCLSHSLTMPHPYRIYQWNRLVLSLYTVNHIDPLWHSHYFKPLQGTLPAPFPRKAASSNSVGRAQ